MTRFQGIETAERAVNNIDKELQKWPDSRGLKLFGILHIYPISNKITEMTRFQGIETK